MLKIFWPIFKQITKVLCTFGRVFSGQSNTNWIQTFSFIEWTICKRPPSQYKASFYHTERVDKSDGSFFQPDSCVQYKYNTPWGRAKSTHSRRREGHGSVLSVRTTLHRLSHFFFFCCDPFQISLPLRSLRSCKTQSPIHKEWQRGNYKRREKKAYVLRFRLADVWDVVV